MENQLLGNAQMGSFLDKKEPKQKFLEKNKKHFTAKSKGQESYT